RSRLAPTVSWTMSTWLRLARDRAVCTALMPKAGVTVAHFLLILSVARCAAFATVKLGSERMQFSGVDDASLPAANSERHFATTLPCALATLRMLWLKAAMQACSFEGICADAAPAA